MDVEAVFLAKLAAQLYIWPCLSVGCPLFPRVKFSTAMVLNGLVRNFVKTYMVFCMVDGFSFFATQGSHLCF